MSNDPSVLYAYAKSLKEKSKNKDDRIKALSFMRISAQSGFDAAKQEFISMLWDMNDSKFDDELYSFLQEQNAVGTSPLLEVWLARCYRTGRGTLKNLIEASNRMEHAYKGGIQWAIGELLDILWDLNTEESLRHYISLSEQLTDEGNASAMIRLGRAFKEGRGVPRDFDMSKIWYLKAIELGHGWAKVEYYDLLMKINTPESVSSAIEYASSESEKGNMELRARLGRAYRDGRGIDKDPVKAAELMKETHAGNPQWSKWEYFDILWSLNDPKTDYVMFIFATKMSESGIGEMMIRLARCYRFGRGTNISTPLAREWLMKALEKNIPSAKKELDDLNSRGNII